ncbi:MAG: AAA family ATPase, partial [Actinomycetota bacterium]|nr:AAA family ATPase [Actinomycetota bacterium]
MSEASADPLVGRAVRLFEFLGRTQQLRNQPPRTVDGYRSVLWLDDLPDHPAVSSAHRGDPDPDADILTIERVARHEPPVPGDLADWLTADWRDPAVTPELTDDAPPELTERYVSWLVDWQAWAARERADRPVRARYGQLFAAYVAATGNPEELELVLGVGCLAWAGPGARRHLLTAPVGIRFDDDTGRLTVHRVESVAAADIELDMLDPGLVPNPGHVADIRVLARDLEAHPLHRKESAALVRRVVHALDPDGEYRDDDAPPEPRQNAVAAYAPAVILRRRSQQGLVEIFSTIVAQLRETGVVPDGLAPLVDPDHRPRHQGGAPEGALVDVDGDTFLPLPVNDTQLRIVRQVDAQAQTLVQGPPGTGKTHTAAALLSHLLAQGKRVLVTAHTDRALREVRDKLPSEITPLAVSVVGSSREDMSDLKVAVERIAAAATDHDDDAAADTIRRCLANTERLGLRRAELHDQLVEARRDEVREHEHAGYRGTLAAIARQLLRQEPRFGWLRDHVDVPPDSTPPLSTEEVVEWHGLLTDPALRADESDARQRLVELGAAPAPQVFTEFVDTERAAAATEAKHAELKQHPAFEAVRGIDPAARAHLRRRLSELADEADDLARRRETWMREALADVLTGRGRLWHARAQQIEQLTQPAGELVSQLGPLTEVTADGNLDLLLAHAERLRAHLETGTIKTGPDGAPKIGALTPKVVKQAQPFFDQVRVDGLPPTTPQKVQAFISWARLHKLLTALDRAWPGGVPLLPTDPAQERLEWHRTELDQLHRVVRLGEALDQEQHRFAEAGLPRPDWTDLDAVRRYANLVDVAAAVDAHAMATLPLRRLESAVSTVAGRSDAAPCVPTLLAAVRDRDPAAYTAAYQRLTRLVTVRTQLARRDD